MTQRPTDKITTDKITNKLDTQLVVAEYQFEFLSVSSDILSWKFFVICTITLQDVNKVEYVPHSIFVSFHFVGLHNYASIDTLDSPVG